MSIRRSARSLPWFPLMASLLAGFGMWFWAEKILAPINTQTGVATGRPIGNNSDLYPRWLGARALLLQHRDPYSDEVTREIQLGFYGRALDSSKASDPTAEESFLYPVYTVFLMSPVAAIPFAKIQKVSPWLMLFLIACSVPLWMSATGFRRSGSAVVIGMMLAVGSYPAVLEFHQQNLAALVFFFLAAACASLTRGWQMVCGLLLALATIKPEISGLSILWLLAWAICQWRERFRLLLSFGISMAGLIFASEAILPHWFGKFLYALRAYPKYGEDPSIFQLFLPPFLAVIASFLLLAALAFVCWRWRHSPAGSAGFAWSLAWVVTVTLAVLPKQAGYNQLLLLPALLVLIESHKSVSEAGLFARAVTKDVFICQAWQWIAALALTLSALVIPLANFKNVVFLPLYTMTALTATTLLAVILRSAKSPAALRKERSTD